MQLTIPDPPAHGAPGWDTWLNAVVTAIRTFVNSAEAGVEAHEALTDTAHGGIVTAAALDASVASALNSQPIVWR